MMLHLLEGLFIVSQRGQGLRPEPAADPVYAAERNQVWANLIDNAVSAMGGTGTLTVRTALDADRVLVEKNIMGTSGWCRSPATPGSGYVCANHARCPAGEPA